jgi:glutathione reductase (NADPH)
MAGIHDLIVIGTGTAGSIPAFTCRRAGWRVAVIDERPYGGTCALRGCDPKKVLAGAAEIVDRCRLFADKGLAGQVRIDWPALIRYKRTFTEPVAEKRRQAFAAAGIDTFFGPARFTGPESLEVNNQPLQSRHFVIATGAEPTPLPIPGAEHLVTSEQFLELPAIPASIIFIGGGFISFEFSWVSAAAGVRTTILEKGDRPLPAFDRDLVAMLVEIAKARGIEVGLNMPASMIERRDLGFLVRAGNRGEHSFSAAMVAHGAGRTAKVQDLGLEEADVRYDQRGILVNDYLQSISHPMVYAAGDVASKGAMLTPVASLHGRVAAHNLLHGNTEKAVHALIPSVIFTHPPLAMVGLLPEEAAQQGLEFSIHQGETSSWYTARRIGLDKAGYKMLIEKGTGRILGAHLLAPGAEETINIIALAMRLGISAPDLKKVSWSYPSVVTDFDYML